MAAHAYKSCSVLLWLFGWGTSVKTKIQQRALAGEKYRGVSETLHRLIRVNKGSDPNAPKTLLMGMARIYRGLGVSAVRSITTHGLLWTLFDMVGHYIDNLPCTRDSEEY
ncbi:hypothetical protein C0992_009020 [Termitomyces sp. T32_za158]|nr:hypothetical protein C0992_009020 [Termitomyces sp. T32_za158]